MPSQRSLAIGIDIGATKIAAALVNPIGQVIAAHQIPTLAHEGALAVFDRVAGLIRELSNESPLPVDGVGIGSPGQVNSKTGVVSKAINMGWEAVNLREGLLTRLPVSLPIWIQKDANLSALGEYYFGAAQGCTDFVFLGIGSGLGCGILTNGLLVTGAQWSAADLGHYSLDPSGKLCTCGQHGCAETVISGPGLMNLANSLAQDSHHPGFASPANVISAARAGNELAILAIAELANRLGNLIAFCVALLNPSHIVIGGGLGLAAFDLMLPGIRAELNKRVLPENQGDVKIFPSQVASSAVGAACLVWYSAQVRHLSREEVVETGNQRVE